LRLRGFQFAFGFILVINTIDHVLDTLADVYGSNISPQSGYLLLAWLHDEYSAIT